jgi:hypothetical protein
MSSSRTNHRGVKRRVNPMLGFQSFEKARVVIAGIELAQKISQRPYDLRRLEWHRREPGSRVAAGDGGLNTDGKEERFVLRLLGSGVCNRTALSTYTCPKRVP